MIKSSEWEWRNNRIYNIWIYNTQLLQILFSSVILLLPGGSWSPGLSCYPRTPGMCHCAQPKDHLMSLLEISFPKMSLIFLDLVIQHARQVHRPEGHQQMNRVSICEMWLRFSHVGCMERECFSLEEIHRKYLILASQLHRLLPFCPLNLTSY